VQIALWIALKCQFYLYAGTGPTKQPVIARFLASGNSNGLLVEVYFSNLWCFGLCVQYDLSASQFSPDGRVFQVEYAQKAVENSGLAIYLPLHFALHNIFWYHHSRKQEFRVMVNHVSVLHGRTSIHIHLKLSWISFVMTNKHDYWLMHSKIFCHSVLHLIACWCISVNTIRCI
jgi:hypothetical protein